MNQIDKAVQAIREAAEQEITKLMSAQFDSDWEPKEGERYWFVSNLGTSLQGTWRANSRDHRSRLGVGNVYQTKQLADQARDRDQSRGRVYRMIRDANRAENWRVDFSDRAQDKYFVYYDRSVGRLISSHCSVSQSLPVEMYGCKKAIGLCIAQLPKDFKRILGAQV